MRKTISTKQLRELRINVSAAARLTRIFTPHLVRHLLASLEVAERVRRARMSSRERRLRRSLRLGAYAVGLAAAGVAAGRLAAHGSHPGDDGPALDRP